MIIIAQICQTLPLNLSFDRIVKSALLSDYADKKKLAHIINLVGVASIAIAFSTWSVHAVVFNSSSAALLQSIRNM